MKTGVYFILLSLVLGTGQAFSQQSEVFDKEKFLQMAQAGILARLTPEQVRQRIKEAGLTEEEAIRLARERNIDLGKYLRVEVGATEPTGRETKIEVAQPTAAPVEVKVPVPEPPETIPVPPSVERDATPVPKGPHGLDYFGYDKRIPAAFEPTAVGPVDPGYLVGPGDVLRLTVWGQAEFQYQLEVDREGRVFIPNVGQVFVMGTPLNALYSVGGPLVRGSLRNINVLRENKVVATVDLYDFLLRGDQTSDVRFRTTIWSLFHRGEKQSPYAEKFVDRQSTS